MKTSGCTSVCSSGKDSLTSHRMTSRSLSKVYIHGKIFNNKEWY